MSRILAAYKNFVKQFPYLSQCVQAGILMGSGDIISQKLIEKRKKLNVVRTAQLAGVGFFLVAPCLRAWYGVLDKYVVGDKGTIVTLKKVALDQLCFAPIFIPIMLTTLGVVQTLDIQESLKRTKRDYVDVLITNYKLWPCVQLGNFYFVPLQYQVLVANIVALIWNTYISWKTQADKS